MSLEQNAGAAKVHSLRSFYLNADSISLDKSDLSRHEAYAYNIYRVSNLINVNYEYGFTSVQKWEIPGLICNLRTGFVSHAASLEDILRATCNSGKIQSKVKKNRLFISWEYYSVSTLSKLNICNVQWHYFAKNAWFVYRMRDLHKKGEHN